MTELQSSRQSVLNDRHRALGSDLSRSWNDMPVPYRYATSAYDEIAATRYRAGLIDISAHKILTVQGPQATQFLNYILSSNLTQLVPGQSHVSNVVNEAGGLIDDVLVYCDGPNQFRLSHGSGALEMVMADFSPQFDVVWIRDDDTHLLSLQGPLAARVLAPHTDLDLRTIGYFTHHRATLFGHRVIIARAGFFGEQGYELFCSRADTVDIWDQILAAGKPLGVMALSWACLEIARLEAGLLFFPFEMRHADTTPWEVGAGWTVDLSKPEFRGKSALAASQGHERTVIAGLEVLAPIAMTPLAKVMSDGQDAGIITSAVFSQHLMKSIALAQISPSYQRPGTALVVHDAGKTFDALVVRLPFYDPLRLRTLASN